MSISDDCNLIPDRGPAFLKDLDHDHALDLEPNPNRAPSRDLTSTHERTHTQIIQMDQK
jgi:hypothetical protein